jgi:hypothetical protein
MPQIFDPTTFSAEQAKLLVNIPGKSLAETNTPEAIRAAQALNPSPNIPVYQIEPTTPFKPVNLTDTTNYNALLAGTKISLPEPKTPEQLAYEKTQQDYLAKMKDLTGQEAFAQQKAQELGIPEKQKELNDLQAQLRTLNAEAAAQQEALANQPILSSIALGQQAQVERTRAIKALSLSAQIQALQGNIALAQDQVQQAVDLKYKPIIQELNLLNQQLEFNKEFFNAAEKKRAEELKRQNDLQLKQLEIQIANEKDKNATLLNQMQAYPDAGITLNDTLETANQKIQRNSKIYMNKIKGEVGVGTTGEQLSPLAQAVVDGTITMKDLTPTLKAQVGVELNQKGFVSAPPEFAAAKALIGQISELSKSVNTAKGGIGRFVVGAKAKVGALLQTNQNAALFEAQKAKISLLVRALGEKGVLTDKDVERVSKSLPNLYDSKEIAEKKLSSLLDFISEVEQRNTKTIIPQKQSLESIFNL